MRVIIHFILFLVVCQVMAQEKKVELTPSKSIGKVRLQGKKNYTYYALSEETKTSYKVEGPGKLQINARVRISNDGFKSTPFRIKHVRSGKFVDTELVPELLAGNLKILNKSLKGTPSRSHKLVIDVPPGKHTYDFFKYRTDQKVHIRAFYQAAPKPIWQPMTLTTACSEKSIRYVESGTERVYHRITKQRPMGFSVSRSNRLRVIVRPEFTYSMLDETILKLKLENTSLGTSRIYKVNAQKSNKLEFTDDQKQTPGTATTFYIDLEVPSNTTEAYALSVVGGAKAALIRLSQDQNMLQ